MKGMPQDFGKKIGGARKDMASKHETKGTLAKKDAWPVPDYKARIGEPFTGLGVLYWAKNVRDAFPARSKDGSEKEKADYQKTADMVSRMVDGVGSPQEAAEAVLNFVEGYTHYVPYITQRLLNQITVFYKCADPGATEARLARIAKSEGFPDAMEKAAKKTRGVFVPSPLASVERDGPQWRGGMQATGARLMDTFGFRGGEFGNWLSGPERQMSLDMAHDAFMDLASCIGIEPESVSLRGELSIAFGARGKGGPRAAVAHYERRARVINLTRMRGAGSLAHEWFHALDYHAGRALGIGCAVTESVYGFCEDLRTAMREKPDGTPSDYLKNSRRMEAAYARESEGYWSSTIEMAARAFACWTQDRLGYKSDYLNGHAESAVKDDIHAFPEGEERERINAAMDKFLEALKDMGILKAGTPKPVPVPVPRSSDTLEMPLFKGTQLCLFA